MPRLRVRAVQDDSIQAKPVDFVETRVWLRWFFCTFGGKRCNQDNSAGAARSQPLPSGQCCRLNSCRSGISPLGRSDRVRVIVSCLVSCDPWRAPSIGIPIALPCPGAARFIPVRRRPQRYVYAQQEGRRLAIWWAGRFDTNFTGAILRVMVTLYWLKISRTAATTRLSSLVSCASSRISSRKVVFIEALPAG